MKKLTWFTLVTMIFFCGFANRLFAYEGGTKLIATMTHPETQMSQSGPLLLVSHDLLTPGKVVTGFMRRIPEPTLSVARIRAEQPGKSLGTKSAVQFWKRGSS